MTLLAVYFQLASSNSSYIVEPYNFQLNAVNKTIHLTNFPSLLLFISLNTWASTWYIFPLTKSYFKLDHVYCQQNFWIFVHNSVQSLIKTREPPPPPPPSPVEAFVGVGGTLVHFALRASDYLHLLTCVVFISSDLWSVMKFLIIWFLMVWFDQNLWLTDHKVAIKKKQSKHC